MWKQTPALSLALAGFIAGAAPAVAQTPLDREALTAHGFEIASFTPADAFSPPPDESALVGQAFRYSWPLVESDAPRITHLIGGWTYDQQAGSLRVAISPAGWRPDQLPDAESNGYMEYGLRVGTRNLSNQMATAQNAFGAQYEIQSIEAQAVHLGPLTQRERAASVAIPDRMFADVSLSPEDARRAVDGAEVVVEGELVALPDGRLTLCYDTGSNATVQVRLASVIRTCVMNARITRVAIVAGTGEVLQEWRPTPAKGPRA